MIEIGLWVMAGVLGTGSGASLTTLGELPGGDQFSRANAVSPGGTVIVGQSSSGADGGSIEAFRWTPQDGMVTLADLDGGPVESIATGVSAGGVIVGRGHTGVNYAVAWFGGGPPFQLPELPRGGIGGARADAITPDGSVIVGTDAAANGVEAFRYEGGAIVGLGDLPGGIFRSDGNDVSADGQIIVGSSSSDLGTQAMRYTAETGMVGLGDLPGGTFLSIARGISADGVVIVGQGRGHFGEAAFRWTAATGMVELGPLVEDETSRAYGVNADGSVVVGRYVEADDTQHAIVWTPNHGVRTLASILTASGVDLQGFASRQANAVSDDGRVVVGFGTNAEGWTEAFAAVIPSACTSDVDADGTVAFGDLLEVLATWGPCPGCASDLDFDGIVAFPDLLQLLANWGPCPS